MAIYDYDETRAVRERRRFARAWLTINQIGHRPTAQPPTPPPNHPRITFLAGTLAVIEEGLELKNCVALYARDALEGKVYVFHIDHPTGPATVIVDAHGEVRDAAGKGHNLDHPAAQWGRQQLAQWGRTFPPNDSAPHWEPRYG
jgi:hypothetical protein